MPQSNFRRKAKRYVASALLEVGLRVIKEALKRSSYTRDTGNMDDAYACVVYYNGSIAFGKDGKRAIAYAYTDGDAHENPAPTAEKKHKGYLTWQTDYGRNWAAEWVNKHTAGALTSEGNDEMAANMRGRFTLVILNAAFYAGILEDGRQGGSGRKYKVLSFIANEFESAVQKLVDNTNKLAAEGGGITMKMSKVQVNVM